MLVPKSVTVNSSFKAYGFRDGLSGGSDISVTFDIPEGYSMADVRKEIIRQKFNLDVLAMRSELGKGLMPLPLFEELFARAKKFSEETINGIESSK